MIAGNTYFVEEADINTLDNIPTWLTGYVQINTDGEMEAQASGSPLEVNAGKSIFYIDPNDSKRYHIEPEGTPTEIEVI